MSPCTAYTLAGDSISRDCISPASHQATPGSMQPSRPSPLSPHLLNRRGAQSARPLRPSRPRSASRATAAAPTPHRTPRRCCGPVAPPSRGCCTTPRRAATPSPLRRRRLAVVLPLRRRRLAAVLRCVAGASPSRCCGAVTLPPSCAAAPPRSLHAPPPSPYLLPLGGERSDR